MSTVENVTRRFLAAEDPGEAIPKGTVFEVVMKHGDWWSEMRKGVQLETLEEGTYGTPIKFREKGWGQGAFALTPIKEKGKIRLKGQSFGRALTVKLV